jgi:hypothetical protein
MTIKELQEGPKEIQEWTDEDWAEVEQILYRGTMPFKKFCRLYELTQTEEAQKYIRLVNQLFRQYSSLLENVELSGAPSQWLLDQIREGGRIVWALIHAVPKCLRTTMGDIRLLFFLRQIESPEVVLDVLCQTALSERCRKEAIRRISAFSTDVAGAIFLEGKSQTESVEAIMAPVRAHTRKLWLPQERGTSEHRAEKDGTLGELLSEQIDKLKELSVEEFFIQAMEEKLHYLPYDVRNRFVDEIRKQNAQKRMPSRGFVSLDEVTEDEHGEKVPMLELLEADGEKLQTQPMTKVEEELTQAQRQQLENLLGKKGLKIFEYRYRHSNFAGQEGEGKEISRVLGIAESTVGRYIGTKNRIGIFEVKANEIRSIFF